MQDTDDVVSMEMESIYSPAPRDNGVPPEECDYINFLRFRPREADVDPASADAILVLMPGFMGGANSMEYLGRQLVYMALTQDDRHMEVWVVDRRPNNLEDLTGSNAAEEARDTQVYIDYYYNGAEIDGRTFQGFLKDEDMPYLSEFGLRLALEDVYTVITTMVPDLDVRRSKVFVGGHSLGGPLTALFAGWDFDADPETLDDAGYMNCAGLVGLDTIIDPTLDIEIPLEIEEIRLSTIMGIPPIESEEDYGQVVEGMRDGAYPRKVPLPILYPEFLALMEPLAMEAAWNPDEESTLLRRIPRSPEVNLVLMMIQSRSLRHFALPVPFMTDFRYTNEAQFGIFVDNNFQPLVPLQASCGFLSGGAVVKKNFPLPQCLASVLGLSELLRPLLSIKGQFVTNNAGPSYCRLGRGPLYSWANFDEIGSAERPAHKDRKGFVTYTTMQEEVADIQDVARFMYYGPTNAMEWYFALRLNVDMEVAVTPFGPACGLPYLHGDMLEGIPQITFVAEKGPFTLSDSADTLRGYNHLDVCVAAADRPSRRENEVIRPTIDFMLGIIPD